ncbi:MAG: RiPP maturation radical SAM C-methyltransferase [Acidisphaera sp.]|nr:RiPP maturation radical SAM C-methyltransferase [Acidisphaera sp.]
MLLAAMPLSSPHFPNLALGLLKPAVEALGIGCDVRYFSLDYLAEIGAAAHDALTDVRYYMAHVGEWVFAPAVHEAQDPADVSFLTECFRREHAELYTVDRLMTFIAARAGAASFIDGCLERVDWSAYAVVGFTSSFQQTMAALALAKRIKQRRPELLIVFGGANCQDEMGIALHRCYPFIDAVCLGEGDRAFPELVRRHAAGLPLAGIPGMVVRDGGESVLPARRSDPVQDMDALPIPDFDAFFAARAACAAAADYAPAVVFETARGCWWGARQHCTFCGLNGVTMAFRSKSQARAYDELAYLTGRHGCRDVANADNILDLAYFREFIPRLAASGLDLRIYYEVKANLKPEQIVLLARAGIRKIQAGIETLDTELLRLMRKGSSLLQNVQVLKLAAEAGIYVEWLALHGFPGETGAQYDRIAAIIPKLRHLQPPAAFLRARADRFSPYFDDPARYGVTLERLAAYAHIFPFDSETMDALAYHFIMCAPALDGCATYTAEAAREYALWQAHQRDSALWCEADGDAVVVHDQRWGRPVGSRVFTGAEAAVLRQCWRIEAFRRLPPGSGAAIETLEEAGLLLREGDEMLALPLRQPGFRAAPSWEVLQVMDCKGSAFAGVEGQSPSPSSLLNPLFERSSSCV